MLHGDKGGPGVGTGLDGCPRDAVSRPTRFLEGGPRVSYTHLVSICSTVELHYWPQLYV